MRTKNKDYDLRRLHRARLVKGLTISELARRVGIPQPTVSRTLSGRRQNPETIVTIANYLRVPMDELVLGRP